MWTYLLLLFSSFVLLAVFARRLYLCLKKKSCKKVEKEEHVIDESLKKEKFSREERNKLEELINEGETKVKYGKEEEAIKLFIQALAIDSLNIEAQHKLAMLYLKKEMFGAASALFVQLGALTDDPVHYSHLGFAFFRQNMFEEARDAYSKAIVLDDSRPQRFISLGQVYRSLNQLQNAAVAVRRAIDIDAENLDFLFLLTDLQMDMEDFEGAEETLNGLLEIDEGDEDAKGLLRKVKRLRKGVGA